MACPFPTGSHVVLVDDDEFEPYQHLTQGMEFVVLKELVGTNCCVVRRATGKYLGAVAWYRFELKASEA